MRIQKQKPLPPGPRSFNPFRNVLSFRKDSLRFLQRLASQYGDVAYFKVGPIRAVLVNHPDHIREVLTVKHAQFSKGRPLEMAKALLGEGLLTSEGAFHKRQSRLIQPAFHREMIDAYAAAMVKYAVRQMEGWQHGETVDMLEEMISMSTAIAGETLFHSSLDREGPEIRDALRTITKMFGRTAVPFSEWLLKLPLPSTFRFFRAKAKLDQVIYGLIEKHRHDPGVYVDLLSMLLSAQAEAEEGNGLSDRQIRDEALTLLLTAFDTTSLALTWTWYLLAQNPQVEAEMLAELGDQLQGKPPAVADVPDLKYTRMVFGEAMRLYPPIYLITRQTLEDLTIGSYRIPRGTIVLISPYLIHHDARFHPDPERFDPRAWGRRTQSLDAKYTYFPFSRGPRACIGESYAWMEGVLVLATIAQQWRIEIAGNSPVELEQLVNLRPRGGLRMKLVAR